MQAAAASRNTAKAMANENVKIDAIDTPEIVIEDVVGVEGGNSSVFDKITGTADSMLRLKYRQHLN
ncbi:MAG: hypothetical protein E7275_05910 [Pseudobutyrivibrio sp.]|jgi:hypothetical protein|uniref:hypothetical protein n=1 Tax=Pseudobutyrivibrio sp. TaxID=2014367 RepID=UPI0025FCE632|nr:hypothetical protein [Pseudobutyrivibrio sp.]MBE5903808.1 hypothetical protein [Pseudobutyrivibrio sp.]